MANNTIKAPLSQKGNITARMSISSYSPDLTNYYDKTAIDDLLSNKADTNHTHDNYVTNPIHNVLKMRVTSLENKIDEKADIEHTHSYNELTDLPDLEDIGIDTSNLATKEELNGKADVDHDHTVKAGVIELTLQEAYEGILRSKTTESQVNTIITNYAAPIEHVHDQYLTEHQDISGKADITYVDNAINEALGNIESELDEILGEEV